jgi:hypothetical protein
VVKVTASDGEVKSAKEREKELKLIICDNSKVYIIFLKLIKKDYFTG